MVGGGEREKGRERAEREVRRFLTFCILYIRLLRSKSLPAYTHANTQDSDDIEVSTKVRPTVTTVASTARSPFAHATTTTCPTTREKAQLCVNQDTDACHAHKCSIPPKCKCHNWETKRNVSGTNGVTCYVCIDTPPTSPPHITRHTKVDMKSVWAALGCGIVLLLSVVRCVALRALRLLCEISRGFCARSLLGGAPPLPSLEAALSALHVHFVLTCEIPMTPLTTYTR